MENTKLNLVSLATARTANVQAAQVQRTTTNTVDKLRPTTRSFDNALSDAKNAQTSGRDAANSVKAAANTVEAAANAAKDTVSDIKDVLNDAAEAAKEAAAVDIVTKTADNDSADVKADAAGEADLIDGAVKSGTTATLIAAAFNLIETPVEEELVTVAVDDPVANPVEGIRPLEAIGEEETEKRTPFADAAMLASLLPNDEAQADLNQSLLNRLSGLHEGEVTFAQTDAMQNVAANDLMNTDMLLAASTQTTVSDELTALTVKTAMRTANLQPESENQSLISRTALTADEQLLDTTPVTALANAAFADSAAEGESDAAGLFNGNAGQNQQQPMQLAQPSQTEQQPMQSVQPMQPEQSSADSLRTANEPIQQPTQAVTAGTQEIKQADQLPGEAAYTVVKTTANDETAAIETASRFSQQPQISFDLEVPMLQDVSQPQPSYQTADANDIRQQIIDQARLIRSNAGEEMIINLKPDNLGHLSIRIGITQEGTVSAAIRADNAQVAAALESQLAQLKQEFREQGLKVDNVSVYAGLSEDTFAQAQGQMAQQQFAQQQGAQSGSTARDTQAARSALQGLTDGSDGEGAIGTTNAVGGIVSTDASNPVNNATDTILDYRI